MNIFSDYTNKIKAAIADDNFKTENPLLAYEGLNGIKKSFSYVEALAEIRKNEFLPSFQDFARELGFEISFSQQLGSHPDFKHLKNTEFIEKHYIISLFIDIKGSTHLFKRYSPEKVNYITKVIQTAAIHVVVAFGGYVHRLQGDGLFVYFGGKNIEKEDAVKRALQASSLFTYFVKNELKKVFEERDIETIYTRIGIDFGNDADVVWTMAGIGEISEVTTCSLHTNLATKMQSSANSNGIVVGENVVAHSDALNEYFEPVSKRTGKENDRYIFRNPDKGFFYSQYDFNWDKFLRVQSFIVVDYSGELQLKVKPTAPNVLPSASLRPIAEKNTPYYES